MKIKKKEISSDHNIAHESYTCSWNSNNKDAFRRGLIGKLSDFNSIINNVHISDTSYIESMVINFSEKICEVADPLFLRVNLKSNSKHINIYSEKLWFDAECYEAKRLYKQYLNAFNENKMYANRLEHCKFKNIYKHLVRKKKRAYKMKKKPGK